MQKVFQYILMKINNWFTDCAVDGECESCCGSFSFEDKEFTVKRGDYSRVMEKVCYYLEKAQVRRLRMQWSLHEYQFYHLNLKHKVGLVKYQ